MFSSDKNIYMQETEIKPNRYACYALLFCVFGILFCWLLNEIGIFRVGDAEMRYGSVISLVIVLLPLAILKLKPALGANAAMKYVVMGSASVFTLVTTTLLTFHTMTMLLFPMFAGMLYRSKRLGRIAFLCSIICTVISPILGYILHTWDIPLFVELILIGTNVSVEVVGATTALSWLSVGKIILYIVLPRMIMVGSCAVLMFYVISVGVDHVNNQITLNNISHRDVLTGLYNRNYLTDVIGDKSFSGHLTVYFFDVNGLKPVNDRLGHEAGDLMLKGCADCLKEFCNDETSAAFRMGGDEFLLIRFCEGENPREILDAIEQSLYQASLSPELSENGIRLSLAAGFAAGDFTEIEKLIRVADAGMYENKKAYAQSL